jgi:hypothetical protein
MTESISQWSFRAAGALFAIFFFGSLWLKSLPMAPARDDVADRQFEIRMTARYDPPHLTRYGLFAMARTTSRSNRKDNSRALAARFASQFHLPTPARLPH